MGRKRSRLSRWQRVRSFIERCLMFYSAMMLVMLVLWFLIGESFLFTRLFVNLLPGIAYPALLIFPLALLTHRQAIVLMLTPLMLVFMVLYGGAFLPKSSPNAQGQALTLLTYNVLVHNQDMARVGNVITQADADIIAVQEAHQGFLNYADTQLDDYPFRVLTPDPTSPHYEGRAIFSRHPIISSETSRGGARDLLYIRAVIAVEGQHIAVYSIHTYPVSARGVFNTAGRTLDVTILLDRLSRENLPVVVLGDFNMTDATADYRRMRAQFTDVYRATQFGIGTTYPNYGYLLPGAGVIPGVIRIDYGFVSHDVIPASARVLQQGSSDHHALQIQVILPE